MNYKIIVKLAIAAHPIKVQAYSKAENESNIKYYMDNGYALIAVQERIDGHWVTVEAPTL